MRSAKKTLVGAALIAASSIANLQTAMAEKSGLGLNKSLETITTPSNPEGGANCLFTGHVMGLDPRGDNFLSVRIRPNGPAGLANEVDRLFTNNQVCVAGVNGRWLNVKYERNGRMFSGWVYDRYIEKEGKRTETEVERVDEEGTKAEAQVRHREAQRQGDEEAAKNLIDAENAVALNKRIGDLDAQIKILTKIVREQSELKRDANVEVRVPVEETITALSNRIKQLKSEYDVKDEEFSRYLTSVKPNDRDFYLTARRASESYPKIPYYIPGTKEIGEFWIEPTVTDNGKLLFGFKFVDTEASIEKVRGKIDMSGPEIEEVQNALLKLHEWSEKAHHENVRSYEKRVICFPEKDCPPDGERIDGKSSTEIRFIVNEDGATAGRIQRNKGLFVEEYNASIDSALMLQAYLNHVIKAANKEYTSGRRTKKELDDMFK